MKTIKILFLFILPTIIHAQNVSIGTTVNTRARLEVSSTARFGLDNGISVFGHTIGFNRLDGLNPQYMGNGYAGMLHFDSQTNPSLNYVVYGNGTAGAALPTGLTALSLGTTYGNKIQSSLNLANGVLDVARGTAYDGTAVFSGTTYQSHFNYSGTEDTYIRGGKSTSNIIFNDVTGGGIMQMGNGTNTVVGINYNNPVYTFEIRQSGGTGFNMGPPTIEWEWRVSGSPANFYARFNNAIKTYFSPTDGSLHPVSDSRLKEQVETLEPVMDKIMALKPVSFVMKADNPNRPRSIGFIAQDVQKIFPGMAREVTDSIYKNKLALIYSNFAVIAVKGVQEEQTSINDAEIAVMENEKLLRELQYFIKAKNAKP